MSHYNDKKKIIDHLKIVIQEKDPIQISLVSTTKEKETLNKLFQEGAYDISEELITILLFISMNEKGIIVITKIRIEDSITQIYEIIDYDISKKEADLPQAVSASTNENNIATELQKLYAKQLDWYIEQSKLNEERLDKRLKEIMKNTNVASEIDASKIDFSGILPHIMPIIELLKTSLGK